MQHSAGVVRLAVEFFEHYWRHATDPFADEPLGEDAISAQEADLLQLLVQGREARGAGWGFGAV